MEILQYKQFYGYTLNALRCSDMGIDFVDPSNVVTKTVAAMPLDAGKCGNFTLYGQFNRVGVHAEVSILAHKLIKQTTIHHLRIA